MMNTLNRRDVVIAAAAATAIGLSKTLTLLDAASAQTALEVRKGFKHFKVGDVQMTTLHDGVVDRPNEAGFVRNASVDDVKAALKAAGLGETAVPNPFVVPLARTGSRTILFDAGTGGQIAPTTGAMTENMKAAGIDPASVDLILISHFHPDHIFGLMAKETNAPVYPGAEIVMADAEYRWWTDPAVFSKLPQPRHSLAQRIQKVFPGWKDSGRIRLIGHDIEVAPGVRSIEAPGHTPGHTAWHVASGGEQLIVLADTVTFNPIFLRNPGWHAAFDADGPLAEANRRKLLERAIAEKAMVTAYHFLFPSAGTIAKDGAGYALAPVS
jgi:glyoxylase-like metal-dependent hydrolase (beta-lactamase superfamily II)